MAKINVLDKNISELIAAGEVIERPASIVKELLENSIDANSTAITIEIKNGGISYIRISDNGIGIEKDDMKTAFLRHATSKVVSEKDLDSISTLGFRGEALASISAVSKVQMISKTRDSEIGNKISLIAGDVESFDEYGCPNGTTIIVNDLFYNVPARLKFLKKASSESNSIQSIVEKIAISNPSVSFKLIKDNKVSLHTSGDGKLISAIYSVFGREFAKSLLEVQYKYKGISVKGYVTKPTFSRNNRSMQHFFVNDRYIKSKICMMSLEEAYKNLIMVSKFPACVLTIKIDYSEVDVNVHPAKTEIRFSKEQDVFETIYFAVKTALNNYDILNAQNKLPNNTITKKIFSNEDNKEHKQISFIDNLKISKSDNSSFVKAKVDNNLKSDFFQNISLNNTTAQKGSSNIAYLKSPEKKLGYIDELGEDKNISFEKAPKVIDNDAKIDLFEKVENIENKENVEFNFIDESKLQKNQEKNTDNENTQIISDIETEEKIQNIKMIGELFKTYILFEIDDKFVMLDKHACHERIIFEQLKKDISLKESQIMLTPIPLLLSTKEKDIIENNISVFNDFGFEFDFYSKDEFLITSAPMILQKCNLCDVVLDIVGNIIDNKMDLKPEKFEELLHSVACKRAIKANQENSIEELTYLAKSVYYDTNIRHCPHGRPVGYVMTRYDIERKFKRV